MSQENVEIARQLIEFVNRRDWDGIAGLCASGFELRGTIGGLEEDRLVRGVDEFKQVIEREDAEIWDEHLIEPQKFIDAGQQVIVLEREYQRGKTSGVEVVVDMAAVIDVRDGRVVRVQPYMDAAEALEAVGLSKQDAHADS